MEELLQLAASNQETAWKVIRRFIEIRPVAEMCQFLENFVLFLSPGPQQPVFEHPTADSAVLRETSQANGLHPFFFPQGRTPDQDQAPNPFRAPFRRERGQPCSP